MPRPCQAKIVNVNGNFRNGLSKCFESLILERLSISPRGSWRSNKLFGSSIRVFSFDLNESPMFNRLPEGGKSPKTSSRVVAKKSAKSRTSPCKRVERLCEPDGE